MRIALTSKCSAVHRAGDGGYGLGRNKGGARAAEADRSGGHSIQPIPAVASFSAIYAKAKEPKSQKAKKQPTRLEDADALDPTRAYFIRLNGPRPRQYRIKTNPPSMPPKCAK